MSLNIDKKMNLKTYLWIFRTIKILMQERKTMSFQLNTCPQSFLFEFSMKEIELVVAHI